MIVNLPMVVCPPMLLASVLQMVYRRDGTVRKNRSVASPRVEATLLLVEFSMVADSVLILKTLVSKLLKKAEAKDIKLVSGRNSKSSLSITKLN